MGKTAVVTGGSRGIGKAIALKLAKEGYDIALNYANNDEAAKAAQDEISASGVRCEVYKADTSDIAQVKDMFKAIKKAFEYQMEGLGYTIVEVLSTCPTNWGMSPQAAIKRLQDEMIPYYPLGVYKDVKEGKE